MESRYFPEVNEEEEEPEDEGEGSRPDKGQDLGLRPGRGLQEHAAPRAFLGSVGLHLCPGVLTIPWEETWSLGGRIQGDTCCRKAPHKLHTHVQTHRVLEAAAWTMERTVRVSCVHSPLCYHPEAGAPSGRGHYSSPWDSFSGLRLGGLSAALMLLWGPREAMEFMSCLASGLRVSTFVQMWSWFPLVWTKGRALGGRSCWEEGLSLGAWTGHSWVFLVERGREL